VDRDDVGARRIGASRIAEDPYQYQTRRTMRAA
jgi:hypothetical protein